MPSLEPRYRRIQEIIEGHSKEVTLIAVSKHQAIEKIQELYFLGQRDFGENYVQELVSKAVALQERGISDIRWHFIGHLQTNKVKILLPYVFAIHSIDSIKLAEEVGKRWALLQRDHSIPIFIEVNLTEEHTKSGISPDQLGDLTQKLSQISQLSLQGLMCIPDPQADLRVCFRQLRSLELKCRPASLGKLSMGMSSDFELAIQEGSTHVRVGTALFGPRDSA